MGPRFLAAGGLALACLTPQAAPTPTEDFWFHHPVVELVLDDQVLQSGMVTALARDPKGHLYIGTQNGLVSFDGYQTRLFAQNAAQNSLPGDYVRSLLWADGALWVGTQTDGVARFDPQTGAFEGQSTGVRDDQIPPGSVFSLAAFADGDLAIASDGGVAVRDAHTGRIGRPRGIGPDPRCYAVWVDPDQTLWVGTAHGVYFGSREQLQPLEDASLAALTVRELFRDQQGALWIGTREQGVARLDPRRAELRWLAPRGSTGKAGLGHGWVDSISQPRPDEIWVGTVGGGLSMLDRETMQVRYELRTDGLIGSRVGADMVSSLLIEAPGMVWIGTWGGGLYRINAAQSAIRMIREATPGRPGLSESQVHSIVERADGRLLVGLFSNGIDVLDRKLGVIGGYRPGDRPGDLPQGIVNALAETRDGSIWAGSQQSGVYRLLPGQTKWRQYRAEQGVMHPLIGALHESADGVLWLGTAGGLVRFDAPADRFDEVLDVDGAPHRARTIAVTSGADGTVFAATDSGLTWVDPSSGRYHQVTRQSASPTGLSSDDINGVMVAVDQSLWIDTDAAVLHLPNPGAASMQTVDLGRPGRVLGGNLLQDAQGRLWSGSHVYDPASGLVQDLERDDGNNLGTQWTGAYTRLRDGRFVFGGSLGLAVVQPERFEFYRSQPRPTLAGLVIDGKARYVAAKPNRIEIDAQQRNFSVSFAATEPAGQDRLAYQYRLKGAETEWTEVDGTVRGASFGNLWPGEYLLQVQVINRLDQISPHTLEVPILVHPRYWQTRGFMALVMLGLMVTIYGLHRLRTRAIVRRARQLTDLVAVRTNELAQRSRELEARNAQLQSAQDALSQKHAELELASRTDPLTGLRNRRSIGEVIALIEGQHESSFVFMLIDIDHFKRINDSFGHSQGDNVLIDTARKLGDATRPTDWVFRWGGEEFLVIAAVDDAVEAESLATRLQARVSGSEPVPYTVCVGWTIWPLWSVSSETRSADWTDALELADIALYQAKRAGRNQAFGLRIEAQGCAVADAMQQVRADPKAALANGLLRACG